MSGKFNRYGRRDCIPTDPILPYKAPEQEKHPLFHGTGTESVNFMKDVFNMTADEFIALAAIHSTSRHGPGVITKYDWFSSSYLSNMYHKTLSSRPMYRYTPREESSSLLKKKLFTYVNF